MPEFHPELRRARYIPRLRLHLWTVRFLQRIRMKGIPAPENLTIENLTVAGPDGAPDILLRIYRPRTVGPHPALYWIHGGGFVQGAPEQDDRTSIHFAQKLDAVVVSVAYRLAPDHPYPAPMDDVHAGLADNAETLGVDPRRIAIGGASAGAGLAAGLTLRVHDEGDIRAVFQLLVYPMLDDRTTLRTDLDVSHVRAWTPQNNHFGWASYLGHEPGGPEAPEYAAPARRSDLSGLPPTWIGVGTNDLFYEEDVDYARRLTAAGVACELSEVPGAFHGFDALFSKTGVARDLLEQQVEALRPAFR